MDRLVIFTSLALVAAMGFLKLRNMQNQLREKINFGNEFITKLHEFVSSGGRNGDSYTWLWLKAEKMQSQLGAVGIYASYRPPFANYLLRNYAIILNLLPELRRSLTDFGNTHLEYSSLIMECLLRHLGILHESDDEISKKLANPVHWFREGTQFILGMPIGLLVSFGLISTSFYILIINSRIFRFISGVTALISLLSAIIGLILGWDEFIQVVSNFIYRL